MWKFKPIFKQTLWGGERIASFKQMSDADKQIGESWELSGIDGSVSVVSEGSHQGETLLQLLAEQKGQLVGHSVYARYGNEFPLLFKFIDACKDLSIQVHPDDEMAQRYHQKHGKSEMWYVVKTDPGAHLYAGFSHTITPEEYVRRVKEDSITEVLNDCQIQAGDVFYLPAGRIHSLGSGSFVAEIQQASDVTYRVYDFKRKDADGNYRDLHTELAQEALDYEAISDCRTAYEPCKDHPVLLVRTPYFMVTLYDLTQARTCDYRAVDSFVVLMALEGKCRLQTDSGETMEMRAGETVLLPASMHSLQITPCGTVKFLETKIE